VTRPQRRVTTIIALSIDWGERFSGWAEQNAINAARPKPKIETIWIRAVIVILSASNQLGAHSEN
jgi:hypothetical protein